MVIQQQIDGEEVTARAQFLSNRKYLEQRDNLASKKIAEDVLAVTVPAPKFEMHEVGMSSSAADKIVRRHLTLDGKPALNLASFVTTTIEHEGLELCRDNITKNLSDSDEYPGMLELQQRCVSMLSALFNTAPGEHGVGTATTGSSEAVQLGGLAMKRRWAERQRQRKRPTDRPNIIMGKNAQVALLKFANYFDVECRELDIRAEDHFSFSMDDLRRNLDENTIGVFAILGSTYTGHYQDIEAISKVLDEYQAATGNDVPIHVDGASGAFVAPFCTPEYKWDFRLDRVKSINTSGHKFGLAPVGCGWIIFRDKKYLPESLLFKLKYLGGSEVTYTLNFSRPGYQIIHQYYNLIKHGRKGYSAIHNASLENARVFSIFLEDTGYFEVLSDIHRPRGVYFPEKKRLPMDSDAFMNAEKFNPGLPVVVFSFSEEFRQKYPEIPQEAVSSLLRDKGYIIPNYPLPEGESAREVLRVVVSSTLTLDLLDKLMEDIVRVTESLISVHEHTTKQSHASVRAAISIVAQIDHTEEEHEDKWPMLKEQRPHSRC